MTTGLLLPLKTDGDSSSTCVTGLGARVEGRLNPSGLRGEKSSMVRGVNSEDDDVEGWGGRERRGDWS